MAFTRFNYDPCRTMKLQQQATGPGRYVFETPGNGCAPCFMEDPSIRLQKWGANLHTNSINLESDLLGLSRNLNQDCIKENNDFRFFGMRKHRKPYFVLIKLIVFEILLSIIELYNQL